MYKVEDIRSQMQCGVQNTKSPQRKISEFNVDFKYYVSLLSRARVKSDGSFTNLINRLTYLFHIIYDLS